MSWSSLGSGKHLFLISDILPNKQTIDYDYKWKSVRWKRAMFRWTVHVQQAVGFTLYGEICVSDGKASMPITCRTSSNCPPSAWLKCFLACLAYAETHEQDQWVTNMFKWLWLQLTCDNVSVVLIFLKSLRSECQVTAEPSDEDVTSSHVLSAGYFLFYTPSDNRAGCKLYKPTLDSGGEALGCARGFYNWTMSRTHT